MAQPRESWLQSDDPEKWAAAICICKHGAGHCGQDGYCHYGDCFKHPATKTIEQRVIELEAKVAELESRLRAVESSTRRPV